MNKYSMSIKYGVIAGIIMVLIILLIYLAKASALAGMMPRTVYVVLVFMMIWGGITVRRQLGNFDGYKHAFLTVFIISVIATTVFDSFNFVLIKFIDPSIPALIKAKKVEIVADAMEKIGASDKLTEDALKEIRDADFTPTVKTLFDSYARSIIIGAIFSALIGLFVNRSDERVPIKAEE